MKNMAHLLYFEVLLITRQAGQWLNACVFFIIVCALFPLGISADPLLLKTIGPGIIWITIILALLLALENIFRPDYEDGFLSIWCLSTWPLSALVLMRIAVTSVAILFPLAMMLPIAVLFFQLSGYALWVLFCTACIALPLLLLLGTLAVALTLRVTRSSVLVALLVLPLYIPILVFATGAVMAAEHHEMIASPLAFLGALSCIGMVTLPFAIASSLRAVD